MSDYQSDSGKLRKVIPENSETFDDMLKRLWIENEKPEAEFSTSRFFDEFYDKFIEVDNELWEIFEHKEHGDEDDTFCRITNNNDGTYSFHTRYYNGGTCMTEMIEDELKKT